AHRPGLGLDLSDAVVGEGVRVAVGIGDGDEVVAHVVAVGGDAGFGIDGLDQPREGIVAVERGATGRVDLGAAVAGGVVAGGGGEADFVLVLRGGQHLDGLGASTARVVFVFLAVGRIVR